MVSYLTISDVFQQSGELRVVEIARKYPGALDLLVSDVVIKGTTGPELSDKLKLFQPEMKVLYMSGYVGDKVHDYGHLEVLEKPFAKDELLGRMRAALGSK